ncbi:hydroxyacid dehydrogenase [Clostridium merdae]|uniref:hydroxyacid dehydrogenase n=1 Tax=Clostridium merdae TaxID=1958780 RepID=UPI000A26EB2F|nr:hydroxyacid dehydrogenase [Clostridium merdae]
MAYKVLLPQPILKEGYDYLLEHGYEIIDGKGPSEEDILSDIASCDAMIVRTAKITARILDAAPNLRVIARHGAGYDGVDLEAARRNNILVMNAPGVNSISVAELAIFYMLHCSRNFKLVQKLYQEDYSYAKFKLPKTELNGKTLGLVGLGNIGKLVAQKAAMGFDMKVIAFDPFHRGELPDYIKMTQNRDEIFSVSDYVSVHVPATKETIHSIGQREFSMMKETAFLINTARGSIVDETALIQAMEEKQIAGAALDVLWDEPFQQDNPLLQMDNVLTAPHIGAATKEASSRASLVCAQNIDDFFCKRPLKAVVPELKDLIPTEV